jgi:hypothetical protein
MNARVLLSPLLVSLSACVGTTGSGLVDFSAFASGPAGASGEPGSTHAFELDTPQGYHITLTQGTMHIGAVYLKATVYNPSSAEDPSCIDGLYVAQVPGSIDGLDVLSATPQPFSIAGTGTVNQALTGELWLTGGDVNEPEDPTPIVVVAGTATRGGVTYPFEGTVTIGSNRAVPVTDPSQPGLNPICKRRIVVVPIARVPVVEPLPGTALHVTVDPREWFTNLDFSQLDLTRGPPFQIPDADSDVKNGAPFLQGIESGDYSFAFESP